MVGAVKGWGFDCQGIAIAYMSDVHSAGVLKIVAGFGTQFSVVLSLKYPSSDTQ